MVDVRLHETFNLCYAILHLLTTEQLKRLSQSCCINITLPQHEPESSKIHLLSKKKSIFVNQKPSHFNAI